MGKESWTEAARPARQLDPIRTFMLWAVDPMMPLISPRTFPPMKNQRRPKMSDSLPTRVYPRDAHRFQPVATQTFDGSGPDGKAISCCL